jgi:hypothetical protein
MNMMKKMYDEGDDTMKKVPRVTHTAVAPPGLPRPSPSLQTIGEAMLKSRMGGGAGAPGGDFPRQALTL